MRPPPLFFFFLLPLSLIDSNTISTSNPLANSTTAPTDLVWKSHWEFAYLILQRFYAGALGDVTLDIYQHKDYTGLWPQRAWQQTHSNPNLSIYRAHIPYTGSLFQLSVKSQILWSYESYPAGNAEFRWSWCGWRDSPNHNYLEIIQVSSLLTLIS